jgi:hypothetical protein
MKVKSISCTQFAGIHDKNILLDDGINIIYGKNETGKSTLVNLLSRTLFQNARLDGRKDKDFQNTYFPSSRKTGSAAGDFIDGNVMLETPDGIYTISKEWGVEPRSILKTPDGAIRDQKKIDEILRDVLQYGEGIYSDMLLSSQRNADDSLQTILDATRKTDAKQEIANAVTMAFAASDGVSVDAIEQRIDAEIDKIAGKHWDTERGTPVRKTGGEHWANGLGEILAAYYALEDAKRERQKLDELEDATAKAEESYKKREAALRDAEEKQNSFSAFHTQLTLLNERKKSVERLKLDLKKYQEALTQWPRLNNDTGKAKALQAELERREILDQYESVERILKEQEDLKAGIQGLRCPTEPEIANVKKAQRKISELENKLCGMNLTAAIKMLGDHTVTVTSLRTGEPVDISGEDFTLTEAVTISIPDVMTMQLAPMNIDIAAIESEIADKKALVADILGKYSVDSLEELETLSKTIADTNTKIETASVRLAGKLGSKTLDELKAAASAVTDPARPQEDIAKDILETCGSGSVSTFVASNEARMEGYCKEYNSMDALKQKVLDTTSELEEATALANASEDIPAEYRNIADPEAYSRELSADVKDKQKLREDALNDRIAADSKLEEFQADLDGDPAEKCDRAERNFEAQKEALAHWLHIRTVFRQQKEQLSGNPMQDIADSFTRYLGIITGDKISSEFPDAGKLNLQIYSDDRPVDYSKLSEGTKETVFLAFRLAVLDHLFPDGGGVIVLDDPFTDMDDARTAQSCDLVQACAKRHQIIFLTCKEEYLKLLNGNVIEMTT